jgi:hypothetical protein
MTELTVNEYAAQERVDERTVRRWIAKGAVRLVDGRVVGAPQSYSARDGLVYSWFSGVYFVQCDRFVKIGYAHDVRVRLKALQTASPFPLKPLGFMACPSEDLAKIEEADLHRRFAAYRLEHRTEWFHLSPEITQFIEGLMSWPAPKGSY